MGDSEVINYYLVDIKSGKSFPGFDENQLVYSPLPPKAGEYLNQSGIYFEVVTLLQHFDTNYVEVFARVIGDSKQFLDHIKNKYSS